MGADDLPEEFDALPRKFFLSSLIDEGGVVLKAAQEAQVELGGKWLVGGGDVLVKNCALPLREGE